MAHRKLVTVSKLNPNLRGWVGWDGVRGNFLPPLLFGIPLITQKR